MNDELKESIDAILEDYDNKIQLRFAQVDRIESARNAISELVAVQLDIEKTDIFTQGSYSTGTAIRPSHGGSYDVDVVVNCGDFDGEPSELLLKVKSIFIENGTYSNRVIKKDSCVKLEYAEDRDGSFFVDVVPVRNSHSCFGPLELPSSGNEWKDTAPREFTTYCNEKGDQFARIVRLVKHWRNVRCPEKEFIKSILLQTILGESFSEMTSDFDALVMVFRKVRDRYACQANVPRIGNPVLASEDLAENWSRSEFEIFKDNIKLACEALEEIEKCSDIETAKSLLADFFGAESIDEQPSDSELTLGDVSHQETFEKRGWEEDLRNGIQIKVIAQSYLRPGKGLKGRGYRYLESGQALPKELGIEFHSQIENRSRLDISRAQIWYRVTNTGDDAIRSNGLRGNFFGHEPVKTVGSETRFTRKESTRYKGIHIFQVFLVLDNRVIAKSEEFFVKIRSVSIKR